MAKIKTWYSGDPVSDLPEYVKLVETKSDYFRGKTHQMEAGSVFKVRTHGRTLTLEGTRRWARYQYSLFVPSSKQEFNEFKYPELTMPQHLMLIKEFIPCP